MKIPKDSDLIFQMHYTANGVEQSDRSSVGLIYDFNWQSTYRLETPLRIPAGTKLACTGVFDNSAANPNNPDPTQEVRWGDQTWEEMMGGLLDYYYIAE